MHALFLNALRESGSQPGAIAPLLVATASVVLHQGIVRRSRIWLATAGLECFVAIHADLFLPSHLPADRVIWVLLACWTGTLTFSRMRHDLLAARPMGFAAAGFAGIILLHILVHRPWSDAGLSAMLIGGLLAAWNPQRGREPQSLDERLASVCLFLVPVWLVFFWLARVEAVHRFGDLTLNCALGGGLAVLLTGEFIQWHRSRIPTWRAASATLFNQSLLLGRRHASGLRCAAASVAMVVAAAAQLGHYGRPLTAGELTLLLTLYAGAGTSWFTQARNHGMAAVVYAAQFCLAALFIAIRRQLMLTTEFWSHEYDVWSALAVAYCMAGARRHWDRSDSPSRGPMVVSLFLLPAVACVWVVAHDLGTDIALLVTGLYSLQFAHLGKDRRDSPYNAVATFGFVAFVMILFWGRLEVRYLHAYMIPVGIGVLVLLHLFGGRLPVALRNRVRLLTLISMIGSAGYHALVDDRHALAFNLTVIALSLLSMGLGTVLRVRLYLSIGLSALLVDLAATVYRLMVRMDEQSRMSSVGGLILLLGAALVAGAVGYRTHSSAVHERLRRFRAFFQGWE